VISSRSAGEWRVYFALFSAIKARNLQAPLFAQQLTCTVRHSASWCWPRRTSAKLEGTPAVNSSRSAGAQRVSFALFSAIKARNFAEGTPAVNSYRLAGG